MEAYRRAFIATGSFEPVKHVMFGVWCLAFGMEHYFHHKYHSHAHTEAATPAEAPKADTSAVKAGLPPAAAAAASASPDMSDLGNEIKALREEIAGLRQSMRVTADAADAAVAKKAVATK